MAGLEGKRERKVPKRLIDEIVETKPKNCKKMKATDRKLYEVEVIEIDKAANRVKLHFKGYSEKYDEWRPYDEMKLTVIRFEQMSKPTDASFDDRLQSFCKRLYREIKRKLYSGRREDPEVRIEVPCDEDVFSRSIAMVAFKSTERNKVIYRLHSNEKLDECIGLKWSERIMNENGDFAFVVPGTVRFWLASRNPIVEFKLIGDKYIRSEIDGGHQVVFTFVRGDSNRKGYKEMVHKEFTTSKLNKGN